MKTIIITGFGPFGDYKYNPTEESTQYFNGYRGISNTKIIGLVLPCTYTSFDILSKVMDSEKPHAVISTGLSSSVQGVRIETTFHNIMDGKYPDADGKQMNGLPLCKDREINEPLKGKADHEKLRNILYSHDIPVEVSKDAEGFICNAIGYRTTKKIQESITHSLVRNIFIHIPWTDNYKDRVQIESHKIFLKKEYFYRAMELLIKNI